MGTVLPCSLLQGYLTHNSTTRTGSVVLPKKGAGPALGSALAGEGGSRNSSPVPVTSGSTFPPSSGVDGEGGVYSFLPIPPQDIWGMGTALPSSQIWGWLPT